MEVLTLCSVLFWFRTRLHSGRCSVVLEVADETPGSEGARRKVAALAAPPDLGCILKVKHIHQYYHEDLKRYHLMLKDMNRPLRKDE